VISGRIDVHSHLIPGIDDGCANLEQSITCARVLVDAGFTHAFCTPHVWASFPENTPGLIAQRTAELQAHLDHANVALRVSPGGELNLRPETVKLTVADVVTYGMGGKFCLFDLWADELPEFFETAVSHLQSLGLTLVLAHPERMKAAQDDPAAVERMQELGLLLQGNLQCFADPEDWATRRTAVKFLLEKRYTFLATDTHRPDSLPQRMHGLRRAIELAGEEEVARLTAENPRMLLGED
jgi:protein-tyrosine phosphatase